MAGILQLRFSEVTGLPTNGFLTNCYSSQSYFSRFLRLVTYKIYMSTFARIKSSRCAGVGRLGLFWLVCVNVLWRVSWVLGDLSVTSGCNRVPSSTEPIFCDLAKTNPKHFRSHSRHKSYVSLFLISSGSEIDERMIR